LNLDMSCGGVFRCVDPITTSAHIVYNTRIELLPSPSFLGAASSSDLEFASSPHLTWASYQLLLEIPRPVHVRSPLSHIFQFLTASMLQRCWDIPFNKDRIQGYPLPLTPPVICCASPVTSPRSVYGSRIEPLPYPLQTSHHDHMVS
jgi:hypothetical protein